MKGRKLKFMDRKDTSKKFGSEKNRREIKEEKERCKERKREVDSPGLNE